MLLFYIIFGDRNPPYPALGSNIPSARGNIHEESDRYRIYFRLLQQLFTPRVFRFPVPHVPASPSHTSLCPILDVLKYLVSRPQVPSPHTRVPMSPSHFYTQPHLLYLVSVVCAFLVIFFSFSQILHKFFLRGISSQFKSTKLPSFHASRCVMSFAVSSAVCVCLSFLSTRHNWKLCTKIVWKIWALTRY